MKTILKSEFIGFESLSALLCVGIAAYSVEKLAVDTNRVLYLFLSDETVLRVQAKVTEVEPWHEVGTLVFERLNMMETFCPVKVPLTPSWSQVDIVEKLILEGDKFVADCGISIHNRLGEQFIILPGAFPHSVEITAPFYLQSFEPEYEIEKYRRVPEARHHGRH